MLAVTSYVIDFFRFNNFYNFIYGVIIIALAILIVLKSNEFYKETKQKKLLFFASMFFISAIFEFMHISLAFHNVYIEFLNVFMNRLVQCIALLGILFIRDNPPDEKITFRDFSIPVFGFTFVLLIELFIFQTNIVKDFFPNLLNSLTSFAFISVLSSFVFIRILQNKSPFSLFNWGVLCLSLCSVYLINEDYFSSFYRHVIHFLRVLGNLFVFLGLSEIVQDFYKYRFRLKLTLLPNLYMILFFVTFVILGNFVFDLNFTEKIYTAFVLFYCLCIVVQFIFVSGLTMPITQISQALIDFVPGEKPTYIKVDTCDEVGSLAHDINRVFKNEWEYTNQISEKQAQIQELLVSRDTFIAALSHDLKSPIFAEQKIIEFILMDRDAIKISDFIEYMEEMYKTNEEVLRIVNNLLTVYHLDSKEFKLTLSPVNVNALVRDAAKTLGHLAKAEDIMIKTHLDPQVPLLNADEDMIKRVIVNLVSNAIKHSKNSAEVKISTCREAKCIKVIVQDFGKGIGLDDQKNIFQKYPTVKRKVGSGLGLFISKQIIDAHKGKIWFESGVEKGTSFIFTLPI